MLMWTSVVGLPVYRRQFQAHKTELVCQEEEEVKGSRRR